MSLDDHAEELASTLGVDKTEVKEDLANLVEYSVPIDEAKQSLRRKYGDGSNSGATGSAPTVDSIADITTADGSVSVTARVLTKGKRAIFYDGEQQVIREGELGDESGKMSYTAWTDVGFQPGDTVTLGNAGIREYQGTPELNIGESTTITIEEDTLSVPYEIGGDRELTALEVGDRGRTIEVLVDSVERKTIDGRDGETEINSGVFGDESGRLPFTDWEARPEIQEGSAVRIEDVYVREFRGVPEVTVSEFSTITALDRSIEVSKNATELPIGEAIDSGGAYDVLVIGNVIELSEGSGLIERCPECNRVVQNGQCRSHGAVDAVDDLRVKAVLDDGTGTVTAILGDELTKSIYGGGLEKAREAAREAMDQSVVGEAIAEQIVGREYHVRGHLSVDEYGANLDVTTFEASDGDPADRAKALLQTVGGSTEVAE